MEISESFNLIYNHSNDKLASLLKIQIAWYGHYSASWRGPAAGISRATRSHKINLVTAWEMPIVPDFKRMKVENV